jgi:hypothetical protein
MGFIMNTINGIDTENIRNFLTSGDSTLVISALTVIKNAGLSNEKKKDFLRSIYIDLKNDWHKNKVDMDVIKYNFYQKGQWIDSKEIDSLKSKSDENHEKYKVFVETLTGKPSYSVTDKEIYSLMRTL